MRSRYRKALVVATIGGFAAGALGYQLLAPDQSPGTRMVALFERACVPFAKDGAEPSTEGLEQVSGLPGETTWADPDSALALMIGDRDCAVSDILLSLPVTEHAAVGEGIKAAIETHFPGWELTEDGLEPWDAMQTWTPPGSPDPPTRVIQYLRFNQTGPDASTTLRAATAE